MKNFSTIRQEINNVNSIQKVATYLHIDREYHPGVLLLKAQKHSLKPVMKSHKKVFAVIFQILRVYPHISCHQYKQFYLPKKLIYRQKKKTTTQADRLLIQYAAYHGVFIPTSCFSFIVLFSYYDNYPTFLRDLHFYHFNEEKNFNFNEITVKTKNLNESQPSK